MLEREYNVLNTLINRSFPLLKSKRFYIVKFRSGKYSGGALWPLPFLRLIFLNEKKKFSKDQLIGLFSHELSHFEVFQKRGWLSSNLIGIYYWFSPKFREKEEKKVDKLVIRKGYARELSKLKLNQQLSNYYLSPQEIKSYAIKTGKW